MLSLKIPPGLLQYFMTGAQWRSAEAAKPGRNRAFVTLDKFIEVSTIELWLYDVLKSYCLVT